MTMTIARLVDDRVTPVSDGVRVPFVAIELVAAADVCKFGRLRPADEAAAKLKLPFEADGEHRNSVAWPNRTRLAPLFL